MSHFSVGVIISNKDIRERMENEIELFVPAVKELVSEAMQPFDENMPGLPELTLTIPELQEKYNEIVNYEGDDSWRIECKNRYMNKTLQEFCEGFHGLLFKEDGAYSTYNANSKWDWYVIGGRWDGCLPVKDEESCDNGDKYQYRDNVIDNCCKIKDLKLKKDLSYEEVQALKQQYEELTTNGDFYKPEYYKRKFPTFEIYLAYESHFCTYALLKSNGQWIEPGDMGWFGCTSATPEKELEFLNTFTQNLNEENPDDYFVLVDCHI